MGGSPTSSKDIPSGGNPNVEPLPIDGFEGLPFEGLPFEGLPDVDENAFMEALALEVPDDDDGWEEAGIHPHLEVDVNAFLDDDDGWQEAGIHP